MYSAKVMDHFSNPRNVGEIEGANGVGQVGNAKCGDIMKMSLLIKDGVIEDAKFKTFGCGAAVATSSMATELVKGKTVDEALKITNLAVAEALDGLPAVKMHCSNLAEEAIRAAIDNYRENEGLPRDADASCPGCCNKCMDVYRADGEDDGAAAAHLGAAATASAPPAAAAAGSGEASAATGSADG